MNRHMNRRELDIVKIENQKLFERRLYQFVKTNKSNNLEEEMIDMIVSELMSHGKDSNQIRQISQISKILGQSLGLGSTYCDTLELAAKIYDIGNIAILSEIYEKEDTLTFEEFKLVKQHTNVGYEILIHQDFPSTNLGAIISKEHHEWYNGGGYPSQLAQDNINIASRIVSVADTVGALYRKRPGRQVWAYDKILDYVEKRSAIQFDPTVVEVLLINKDAVLEILNIDLECVPCSWYA